VVTRPGPGGEKRRGGRAPYHEAFEAIRPFLLPCAATGVSLLAGWCLSGATPRGQPWTPALTLPQVHYGLSVLLLEVFYTPGIDSICRQVSRQLMRNELARFYHHRTRKCIPPRKLRREIQ
jgi:hypothetical protein